MENAEYTVGQVAKRIADSFGRFSEDYIARQLRAFLQHGAVTPARRIGEGEIRTAVFTDQEIAKACLIISLSYAGISRDRLIAANKCFGNISHEDSGAPGQVNAVGFARVFAGILANEEWYFNFYTAPGFDPSGVFSRTPKPTPALMAGYATMILSTADHVAPLFGSAGN